MEETDFEQSADRADEDIIDEVVEERIATTFDEILPEGPLLEGVRRLGFTTPTPVQARTVPVAMRGGDMIVQAKTGSGKTLAYVLPLLSRLAEASLEDKVTSSFALVVVPTRELALQVVQVVKSLTDEVRPACLIGGMDMQQQYRELEQDRRVIVGTPGRILDFLRQKVIRLNQCRYFVLDEVDEMLSIGFIDDVRTILSRLPDQRQGLFLSATVTPRVDMLAHSFLSHPEHIILNEQGNELPSIEHWFFEIGGDLMAKPGALCDLIETLRPASAIIFCNTKSDTQLVEVLLRRRGFEARRLNSDLSQSQRNRVMKKIRAGKIQFLVATDIAARGIDIAQIDLVINYAIHEQPEIYVHRTGRTGRAGRHGRAISLVGPRDFSSFHFLTKVVERPFERKTLPTDTEVADARVAHVYELIRQQGIELKDRDVLVARRLLLELGGIESPPEELEQLVAKLCRHTIEHFVQAEAKSLEEEMEAAAREDAEASGGEGERREGRRRGDRDGRDSRDRHGRGRDDREGGRSGRGRDRDRDRGGRREGAAEGEAPPESGEAGERRSYAHGREQSLEHAERPGDRRRRDERPREDRNREGNREVGREDRPRESRDDRPRDDRPDRRRDDRSPDRGPDRGPGGDESRRGEGREGGRGRGRHEVRVYVGQGTTEGMTPPVLSSLVTEFADVDPVHLRNISMREHYGFVDLPEAEARKVIENLNGIEYNGQLLPVELAPTPAPPEDRRGGGGRRDFGRGERGGDRGGDRRRSDDRGGDRRNDRRRGGEGRHDRGRGGRDSY